MTRDGGPAFPCACDGFNNEGNPVLQPFAGMSLRDWFAGQALKVAVGNGFDEATIAAACYRLADAMLAEGARK